MGSLTPPGCRAAGAQVSKARDKNISTDRGIVPKKRMYAATSARVTSITVPCQLILPFSLESARPSSGFCSVKSGCRAWGESITEEQGTTQLLPQAKRTDPLFHLHSIYIAMKQLLPLLNHPAVFRAQSRKEILQRRHNGNAE